VKKSKLSIPELIIVLIPHIVDVNKKPSLSEFDISIFKKEKK
jgi:hypothetical protein